MSLDLNLDDESDIRTQVLVYLSGAITHSVRALRIRVINNGIVELIAYFERIPLFYEKDLLEDAIAGAASTIYRGRLQHKLYCVVTDKPVRSISDIDDFEDKEFGAAIFKFWMYVRHGEFPGDDEDIENNAPLDEGQFIILN
ncbi:hypothetical protein LJC47_00635 [Desulfosarcina sp. OttesenSCG-928-B08]|nr:hypothetical protein [Desulfosarcina sp. OttesenSCG-928-B08]